MYLQQFFSLDNVLGGENEYSLLIVQGQYSCEGVGSASFTQVSVCRGYNLKLKLACQNWPGYSTEGSAGSLDIHL